MGLNNGIVLFFCCFCLSFLNGCGLTGDLLDWKGDSGLESYSKELDQMLSQLDSYKGKKASEIKEIFGTPDDISSPGWYNKTKYEEEWYYKIEKGIPLLFPDQYSISFFFNEGKVAAVDAL